MQGSYTSDKGGNMELALDVSGLLPSPAHRFGKCFLNVIRSQQGRKYGEGTLEYLSVFDYRDADAPKEYVCRNVSGTPLALGSNLFGVQLRHAGHFSANCHSPVTPQGTLDTRTFLLRTASGHYAKLRFTGSPNRPRLTYTLLK